MHEGMSPTEKAFPSSCLARSVVATHNNYIHLYPLKGHTILHNLHRMFLNGESVTFIPCSENSDCYSHNDNQTDDHHNKCNNYTNYGGYCYGCLCCRLHTCGLCKCAISAGDQLVITSQLISNCVLATVCTIQEVVGMDQICSSLLDSVTGDKLERKFFQACLYCLSNINTCYGSDIL